MRVLLLHNFLRLRLYVITTLFIKPSHVFPHFVLFVLSFCVFALIDLLIFHFGFFVELNNNLFLLSLLWYLEGYTTVIILFKFHKLEYWFNILYLVILLKKSCFSHSGRDLSAFSCPLIDTLLVFGMAKKLLKFQKV